jgi:hypothetical protein
LILPSVRNSGTGEAGGLNGVLAGAGFSSSVRGRSFSWVSVATEGFFRVREISTEILAESVEPGETYRKSVAFNQV